MRRSRTAAAGLLAGTLFALFASAAFAQQEFAEPNTHHTCLSGPPDGTSLDVTYYIGPGFTAAQTSLILQAAAAWSEAATGVPVNLVAGGPGSDITLTSTVLNLIIPNDVTASGVLTPTIPAGVAPDGHLLEQITGAAIAFLTIDNGVGNPPWHTDINTLPAGTTRDFYSAMLRQFGLALGLGFATTDPLSVMTGALPPNGTVRRSLSAGDVAALQHLYGTPEPATWALFGLGLLGVGFGRRTRPRAGRPS